MTGVIEVFLGKALICFAGSCHPMLYGKRTPIGDFDTIERRVMTPGYGGDVIQFHETDKEVFSIHRLWLLSPKQQRTERLESETPDDNEISDGCINLRDDVYEQLKDCCVGQSLIIRK